MASPRYIKRSGKSPVWEVKWSRGGVRKCKHFRTEAEAQAFAETLPFASSEFGKGRRVYACDEDRIKLNVSIDENGCWNWKRALHPVTGYASLKVRGRYYLAHRFSYMTLVGPIPEGLTIDHLCRNRACVNPQHLEPVTQRVNVHRSPIARAALNALKTHCPQNHPYDADNTRYQRKGGRLCRTCQRDHSTRRAFRAANVPTERAA